MTYEKAAQVLASARNQEAGKPIARNTRLFKRGNDYAIRFHYTDVVTIHADGTFTLNAGSWQSVTTKARMNEYAPVRIYQKDFNWFVMPDYNPKIKDDEKSQIPPSFQNGMRVNHLGQVI